MSEPGIIVEPTSPPTRRNANVSGNIALAVSVFALALGGYQTRLMQSQARANVWPYLSVGSTYSSNTDTDGFIWSVNNNGVGPAKIGSVRVTLDGKPLRHWQEAMTLLGIAKMPRSATSSLSGEVIPPNTNRETTIQSIKINEREAAKVFKEAEKRFRMDVCYCSVYDECWIAHWQNPKVDPVAQCDADGVQFEQ